MKSPDPLDNRQHEIEQWHFDAAKEIRELTGSLDSGIAEIIADHDKSAAQLVQCKDLLRKALEAFELLYTQGKK